MPKFNFNYCKSIFYLFILCLWIKLLLFNYNIQNNLTIIIIYRKMKWRWKGTYIEAGEFGGGHEQIIIINRAGGTHKWMKVGNRASLGSVCVRRGIGQWVVVRVVVVVRAAVVVSSTWCRRWWWWWCRRRGGGVGGVGGSVCVHRGMARAMEWWWC